MISSIGSIPEPIQGITMKGELFDFSDWDYGRLDDYPTVFSVGNVVTGKGNIVASRKHAQHVSEEAIEVYLGVDDHDPARDGVEVAPSEELAKAADAVGSHAEGQSRMTEEQYQALMDRVAERQKQRNYPGSIDAWIKATGTPC